MTLLEERVTAWLAEKAAIQSDLALEAPIILESAMMTGLSLREIARQTKLSPTYLSQILNKKTVISSESFLVLAKVAKGAWR